METYIGRYFLKDGSYSQQIISAVAKEPLIHYNLKPEPGKQTFNNVTQNATPNQIKGM